MKPHNEVVFTKEEISLQGNVAVGENLKHLFQTARALVPTLSAGSTFGKYLVKQVIAEHEDAWLIRAEDPILNRTVILKIYSTDSATPNLQDVTTEGRALAAVKHPNIVDVWGVESHEGRPFLVLEYVDGKTLEEFCDERAVSEATALRIGRQIAEGLVAIHQRGLLHLDLKPTNVMITRTGVVKIIDFGLSRRMDEVSFEEIAGTPGYLAPERSADTPQKIGAATDVFGLGAVIYNMLTTRSPFAGKTKSETALNSVRGRLAVPRWGGWKVSTNTKKLVGSCLDRSPEHRPETAEAVLKKIKFNQRYLQLRKLFSIGLVVACSSLLLARLFPSPIVAAQSLYASLIAPQANTPIIVALGDRSGLGYPEHFPLANSLMEGDPPCVFERLHDHTRYMTARHLELSNFHMAEKAQLDTAQQVQKLFPDAIAYKRVCDTHARIFKSLAKLEFEDSSKIGSAASLLCQAWQLYESSKFPGNEKVTSNLKQAVEFSILALGEQHDWTTICQAEYMLAQLKDLGQPIPTKPKFDNQTQKLQKLYGGASRLEAELNFIMMQRLIRSWVQKGADHDTIAKSSKSQKENNLTLQRILRHGRRTALLAKHYYRGRHLRQAGMEALLGSFEFHWMNDAELAAEHCREVVCICENEAGVNSNCMVQALLVLTECKILDVDYRSAAKHLRQAEIIAAGLVSNTGKNGSDQDSHQAQLSRFYLGQCQEKIEQIRHHVISFSRTGKQL